MATVPRWILVPVMGIITSQSAWAGAQPFIAFVDPESSFVAVDSTFTVTFAAGDPAEHFNGYEVTIQYDPTIVQFESVAAGSLMIAASPFRFEDQATTGSTVTFTNVILAAGVFASGPGPLAVFTFRALADGVSPIAITSDPDCTFGDNGLCVNADSGQAIPREVTLTDGVILVGPPPTDGPEIRPTKGDRLGFRPNPTRTGGEFEFSVHRVGSVRLEVVDVAGRRVFGWMRDRMGEESTRVPWDGRDARGRALPAGVYFAKLSESGRERTTKVVLMR